MDRRNALRVALIAAAASTGVGTTGIALASGNKKPVPAPGSRDIRYRRWSNDADLATGTSAGVAGRVLIFDTSIGRRSHTDPYTGSAGVYNYAIWTSPTVIIGFLAT